jgi:hypothetical protein
MRNPFSLFVAGIPHTPDANLLDALSRKFMSCVRQLYVVEQKLNFLEPYRRRFAQRRDARAQELINSHGSMREFEHQIRHLERQRMWVADSSYETPQLWEDPKLEQEIQDVNLRLSELRGREADLRFQPLPDFDGVVASLRAARLTWIRIIRKCNEEYMNAGGTDLMTRFGVPQV